MVEQAETQVLDAEIARLLLKQRKSKGWTVAELAEYSGVSQAMISKVERGASSPSAAILGRLVNALGITLSKLFAEAELSQNTSVLLSKKQQQQHWTDNQLGITRWSISPAGANPELIKIEIPASSEFFMPANAYENLSGQTIWLLSGQLDILIDAQLFHLETGDCIALTAPADCKLSNPDHQLPCVYIVAFGQKKS
ncbi:XRE family transcriptional regulator [Acinetobacter haemolyticus]|uniref:helix-turn-helix domain-containing protein n=1 Tax=Acinetobacter haemolyticus TaxID=29430 RepID=UPI002A6B289B|nr:XRE family transcriptional regulator [Acinetobacter haemolyticus]WPO66872.1 XRE family transcriptional regulator [Acinetobacter haemolyticus]